MNIALAQLNYHTGNFEQNTNKIISAIEDVKGKADIIVFAELAICGYPPRDFLEFSDFLIQIDNSVQAIANACHGITAIVGAPIKNETGKGKKLFNSALVLKDGEVIFVAKKSLLPTYDIFDEYRYFEPNTQQDCVEIEGKKIALTVCEDLWNVDDNPLYAQNPMERLSAQNPDLIINIAASPYSSAQVDKRAKVLKRNVEKHQIPLVYVNHVGAQTELIFDGDSQFIDINGKQIKPFHPFTEGLEIVSTDGDKGDPKSVRSEGELANIFDGLVLGTRDYFKKLGLKKAVLGLSGGIDSALVNVIAVEALGAENVFPVLMPSQYTASKSISEAEQLAQNLGCKYHIQPIQNIYETFTAELSDLFEGLEEGVTEENLQSRSRGVILMAISNKLGYILLNTTNKSEMAVGYGTLYGDLCGGLSVIGDLYKTQVYELAKYINRNEEIIPNFIITRPPSAELKEDQQDSDSLPPYEILDPLLKGYIEQRLGPKELIENGFSKELVDRVLKLINQSEWKRHQTAPILRVSEKAFGMGRRMPIVAKYLS